LPQPTPTFFPYTTLFRSRLANRLRRPPRSRAQCDHFTAVLLLQLQSGFQRIGVRLVDFEAEVVFLNPGSRAVNAQQRVAGRGLLDRKSTRLNSSHRTISY